MHPKSYEDMIQDIILKSITETDKSAQKYIETNIDLLETDLQKFVNKCPFDIVANVMSILEKSGINTEGIIYSPSMKHAGPSFYYQDIYKHDYMKNAYVYDAEPDYDWSKWVETPTWNWEMSIDEA